MDEIAVISEIAKKIAVRAIVPGYIAEALSALSKATNEVQAAESNGLATLEEEAKKQKILMEFQAHQARVSQELAIAERISASSEVTIEEYFEGAGKGGLGLQAGESSVSVGATGESRRVTKRVIRFNGWARESSTEKAAEAGRQ